MIVQKSINRLKLFGLIFVFSTILGNISEALADTKDNSYSWKGNYVGGSLSFSRLSHNENFKVHITDHSVSNAVALVEERVRVIQPYTKQYLIFSLLLGRNFSITNKIMWGHEIDFFYKPLKISKQEITVINLPTVSSRSGKPLSGTENVSLNEYYNSTAEQPNAMLLERKVDLESANIYKMITGSQFRSRLVFVKDNLALFLALGINVSYVIHSGDILGNPNGSRVNSKLLTSWTAGVGGEYAINNKLIFRVEYRYYPLQDKTVVNVKKHFSSDSYHSAMFKPAPINIHDLRIGLFYKF